MITDYLGNEIKEGMEIVFITVIDSSFFRNLALLVPSIFEGVHSRYESDIVEDKPTWKVGDYRKVLFNKTYGLHYTIEAYGCTFTDCLQNELIFGKMETRILAIKGISDNEEMYLNSIKN